MQMETLSNCLEKSNDTCAKYQMWRQLGLTSGRAEISFCIYWHVFALIEINGNRIPASWDIVFAAKVAWLMYSKQILIIATLPVGLNFDPLLNI